MLLTLNASVTCSNGISEMNSRTIYCAAFKTNMSRPPSSLTVLSIVSGYLLSSLRSYEAIQPAGLLYIFSDFFRIALFIREKSAQHVWAFSRIGNRNRPSDTRIPASNQYAAIFQQRVANIALLHAIEFREHLILQRSGLDPDLQIFQCDTTLLDSSK